MRRGGKLVYLVYMNMVWLDFGVVGCEEQRFVEIMKEEGLGVGGGWLVMYYQVVQRGDEVMERFERVFDCVFKGEGGGELKEKVGQSSMYII